MNKMTEEEVKEQYFKLCEGNGGKPLSTQIMRNNGYGDILRKIYKYWGSKVRLDELLGYLLTHYYQLNNGCKVISLYEVAVGNILINNNIQFITDGLISNTSKHRFDFKIVQDGCEFFIEIWGYSKKLKDKISVNYNLKKKNKVNLYRKFNKILVELDGDKINQLDSENIQIYVSKILSSKGVKLKNTTFLNLEKLYYTIGGEFKNELDSIRKTYFDICTKHGVVSIGWLRENGYSTLANKIYKFWRSKDKLDIELDLTPIIYKWDKESVKKEYHELCLINGNKPMVAKNIRKFGKKGLLDAMDRYWDKHELDLSLGYKTIRIRWDKETVKEEYYKLCLSNNDKPLTHDNLISIGRYDIKNAIRRYWGSKVSLDKTLGY